MRSALKGCFDYIKNRTLWKVHYNYNSILLQISPILYQVIIL